MQQIDLFSGLGGFSLAGEWCGWETVQFCEIDKFCQQVLKYWWPNVPIHSDIKTLNPKNILYDKSDKTIITGGFPCQPYSVAGERKGTEDDRHLWPEMLRVIRIFHPDWVVAENVPGIINWNRGLVFEQVQTDLEKEGYEVFSFVLPACGVNAPHRRDRVWFVAHSKGDRRSRSQETDGREEYKSDNGDTLRGIYPAVANCGITSDSASNAESRQNRKSFKIERGRETSDESVNGRQFKTIQPEGLHDIPQSSSNSFSNGCEGRCKESRGEVRKGKEGRVFQSEGESGVTPNSKRSIESSESEGQREGESGRCNSKDDSHTLNKGLQGKQNERIIGESKQDRNKQSSRFLQPDWENFPTQSPLCSGNDGFSGRLDFKTVFEGIPYPRKPMTFGKWRNESIKALGNAIVPQVAFQIFKVIQEIENQKLC